MKEPVRDTSELGGTDPIDARLEQVATLPERPPPRWVRSRLALGLSPTPLPGLVMLPLGMALGPHGMGLLSPRVVSYLHPLLSVALAALGIFIGLGLTMRGGRERRLLAAASVEAAVTVVVVAGGVLAARALPWSELAAPIWLIAATLGICAAASATPATPRGASGAIAARMGDLDDVLPVVLGGLALAFLREGSFAQAASVAGAAAAIALAIAAAGWLLVSAESSDSQQRVFAVGALLLLAGTAEYLALSALLAGFVAGAFWNVAAGPVRDRIQRDVRHVQHPLVVLLLLVAGARISVWPALASLCLAYVVLRIAGKIVGTWLAGRLVGPGTPGMLGLYLISPGVIGIAFALNALQAAPTDAMVRLLAVVVLGSILSDLVSLLTHPREARG